MKEKLNNIPLWFINIITVISGILTIITSITGFIQLYNNKNSFILFFIVSIIAFLIILICKVKKYQKLYIEGLKITSFNYHKLAHDSRDMYFDVMKSHKQKNDPSTKTLTDLYKMRLSSILNYLSKILEKYCNQEVFCCIKIVTEPKDNVNDIYLRTFCRSNNSETTRGKYETDLIKLCDNTDFLEIVSPFNGLSMNCFYQQNLLEYDKKLRKEGKYYKNSNPNWQNDYVGTIVVPIQIEQNKLYDSMLKNEYHVIGFLCVDSKSDSAFLDRQAQFNTNIVKSFADIIFMLLSQYQHYFKKIEQNKIKQNNS